MWEAVDLRELRVFLALAEELHFGRTADRLRLTPSRVSQSIRGLEHKLGVELVYRTSRHVQLTAVGERFRREAGAAYGQLMDVLRSTQNHGSAIHGVLRLGLLTAPAAGPHLLSIVDAFTARHPQCRVEVAQGSVVDAFGQLHRGEIDVMATAGRDELSFEELADSSVARFEGLPLELLETWVPSRTPSGRAIPRDPQRVLPTEQATLVVKIVRGEIVHPTVRAAANYLGSAEIVYVPVPDMPPMRSALVWRRRSTDAQVREFVAVAREVLGVP
jgi:DNA-binding transcriptional LysR family regulator